MNDHNAAKFWFEKWSALVDQLEAAAPAMEAPPTVAESIIATNSSEVEVDILEEDNSSEE